jgi:site-specific recombinase XerD
MTILPEFAQELQTHLGNRTVGALFETNHATRYSPQRIQQILKETAEQAQIMKRVYPHHLRNASTYCYTSCLADTSQLL